MIWRYEIKRMTNDRWTEPPADFRYLLFERVNSPENEFRYYYLAWQQTLLGPAALRIWGRKGETQRLPAIRSHIWDRLRHGYEIVREEI